MHALFGTAERYEAPATLSWRIAGALRKDSVHRRLFPVPFRVAAQAVAFTAVVAVGVVSGNFLVAGSSGERPARSVAPLSLDVFAAAPPDSPGGVYLALMESGHE